MKQKIKIGEDELWLSNLDKVIYPNTGFSKRDLIFYYLKIAPYILPYLKNRPVTLKRFPNGVDNGFFFEKRCPPFRPQWISTYLINKEKERINACVINNIQTLIWIANLAAIELHIPLSSSHNPERPDFMVFDLDPGEQTAFSDCVKVAFRIQYLLQELNLKSYVKTSGMKGLHIYVPLNAPVSYRETKFFSRQIAKIMEKYYPEKIISKMKKAERKEKVFIDWSQNDLHKTTVCPYSLRATAFPSVSFPLTWKELKEWTEISFTGYDLNKPEHVFNQLKQRGDAFHHILTLHQKLPTQLSNIAE